MAVLFDLGEKTKETFLCQLEEITSYSLEECTHLYFIGKSNKSGRMFTWRVRKVHVYVQWNENKFFP